MVIEYRRCIGRIIAGVVLSRTATVVGSRRSIGIVGIIIVSWRRVVYWTLKQVKQRSHL